MSRMWRGSQDCEPGVLMPNAFEGEIQRSCAALDIYYEKIPIASKLGTANGKSFLLKLRENPYDGFIVYQGKHIPLEMKSQAVFGSFPLSNIADHQVVGLRQMVELGCTPYLLINQRQLLKNGKKVSHNRMWAIDFRDWDTILNLLGDRKSIPVEFFEKGCGGLLTEVPRIHFLNSGSTGLVWDLRTLL